MSIPADKTTVNVCVEISRVKGLIQSPDNPRITSAYVCAQVYEVCVDPKQSSSTSQATICSIRTPPVPETKDPFFNEKTTLDMANAFLAGNKTYRLACQVYDSNFNPGAFIGVASADFSIAKTKKYEIVIPLYPPNKHGDSLLAPTLTDDIHNLGILTVKVNVTVTQIKAKIDPTLDVVLDNVPTLTGEVELVSLPVPAYAWVRLTADIPWYKRMEKTICAAVANEGTKKKSGVRPGSPRRGEQAAPIVTMADVVQRHWKCRRSHQVWTKMRCAAEGHLTGTQMMYTLEDELPKKAAWKQKAYLRRVLMEEQSKQGDVGSRKCREALDRLWMLFATGETIPWGIEMKMLSYEQRTAMQRGQFTKVHYEYVHAAILQMLVPSLDTKVAHAIAKEDVDNDPIWKEPPGSASGPRPPSANGKKEGEWLFHHVMYNFCDWWADTFSNEEYRSLLTALDTPLGVARQRIQAAESFGGGIDVASPKTKGTKSKSKSKSPKRKAAKRPSSKGK